MYKDLEAKLLFHKERIIKEFIKRGVYPDDQMIKDKLGAIDTSLSFLQHDKAIPGQEFDVEVYNNMMKMLYKDLELLYTLLYSITVKEYITLRAFADTHLDELEALANKYELKAEQEANSTSLGKTILFKSSEFNLHIQDNVTIVDLGYVELDKGSRVSCFMNANNIEADKIVFGFKQDDKDPLYVTAYNFNQDSLVIPGELSRTSYTTTIDEDQVVSGPIEMSLNGNKAVETNSYVILGGKDKILVKKFDTQSSQFVMERPTRLDMISFAYKCYIDFYVVGGNQITFRFNKKPTSANFPTNDYKVTNLKHIHHFFIEYDPARDDQSDTGFSFDFELDQGTVYAIKENGTISSDKLFFSRAIDVRDFYVEEYKTGEPESYYAFAKVVNDDGDPIDIESVCIKELLTLGGDT